MYDGVNIELGCQQYNTGEKPTIMLYTYYYINRHAGTTDNNKTKFLYGSMVLLSTLVLSFNYELQQQTVVMLGYDWWLCMVITISVQYNGGLLPDIILLTQGYCHHWGTRLNTM